MEMRSDLELIDQNNIFTFSSTSPLDGKVAVSGVNSPRSVYFS